MVRCRLGRRVFNLLALWARPRDEPQATPGDTVNLLGFEKWYITVLEFGRVSRCLYIYRQALEGVNLCNTELGWLPMFF